MKTITWVPIKAVEWKRVLVWGIVTCFAVSVFVWSYSWFPNGGDDYARDIGPAARDAFGTPWQKPDGRLGMPTPPWAAVFLIPLGIISDQLATATGNALTVLVSFALIEKMGGKWWVIFPVFISPYGFTIFKHGQIEWLPMAGLLMTGGWGIVFLTTKPQVAIGAFASGLKRSTDKVKYALPICAVFLSSLIVWPLWPIKIYSLYWSILTSAEWNLKIWPWGIPVGVFAAWYAWKSGDDFWGVMATPFIVPYVNIRSLIGAIVFIAARYPKIYLFIWFLWLLTLVPWIL